MATHIHRGLDWLVEKLDALTDVVDEPTARQFLAQADLRPADVAPYVQRRAETYCRRCVVRREKYELLVLTWAPSQRSFAHDHAGSLCGYKVVQGKLTEQSFRQGRDGLVRKSAVTQLAAGDMLVDPGAIIHSVGNDPDADELLVTVHLYSPPLPEVRRYAVAQEPPCELFLRKPPGEAKTIAIIGGGFTGAMTLANLLHSGNQPGAPLHIVMIDRQPAFGEGAAYRTSEGPYLLNVPAGQMSAWPDRPDHFLDFARTQCPSVGSRDFLPRRIFGEYIRQTLHDLARSAGDRFSAEIIRDEAGALTTTPDYGWSIQTEGDRWIRADVVVLAVGHRPPGDIFSSSWTGPRHRLVTDPAASLILGQIRPDEPVLLLGSGLASIDPILTLDQPDRTAPLMVVSGRGLMPLPHAREPKPPADVSDLVAPWLDLTQPLTVRRLVSDLRHYIAATESTGTDWRQIIDGICPQVPSLWQRLSAQERSRFLRHVRPFWEIHRHRVSPNAAANLHRLRQTGNLQIIAATFNSIIASADAVNVTLTPRGSQTQETRRVSWVINCAGPGAHNRHHTHGVLKRLLEADILRDDELGLGLNTDSVGRAIESHGHILSSLLVAGTLRKATLWESTSVPELREQAQSVAQAALAILQLPQPCSADVAES